MTSSGYIFLGFVVALVICIDAWIISSIVRSDNSGRLKAFWSAVVILVPLLGWAVWGRFGPRGMAYPPSTAGQDVENALHENGLHENAFHENAFHESPAASRKPTHEKASYKELP